MKKPIIPIKEAVSKIGFFLFILGAAGMDSPDVTVPVVMVAVGLSILLVTSLKENSPAPNRPK